jgi:hypothetical protein
MLRALQWARDEGCTSPTVAPTAAAAAAAAFAGAGAGAQPAADRLQVTQAVVLCACSTLHYKPLVNTSILAV